VAATGLIDTEPEAAFDDLARLAGRLLKAPFAFMTLVDADRSFWKARIGIPEGGPSQNRVEESFCQYVIASGEPLIAGDVTANDLTAANPSIESMGVRAWAGFPLVSGDGQPLGSFCVVDTVVREWTSDDVETLRLLAAAASREVALRAALASEASANEQLALMFAREHETTEALARANDRLRELGRHDRLVSRALQEAMLTQLPEPDHLHLTARYLTADSADQVGGDWYDALLPPAGATTVMIGDVSGHDIAAATVMGQLRNLLRALAWEHDDEPPSAILTRLDRAMVDLGITTMTTLLLAKIEQTAADEQAGLRKLRWSNAGHPSPILIDASGTAVHLDAPADAPLASTHPAVRHDHVATIGPGETLLLYTDGLVETRTDDYDARLAQLLDIVTTHSGLDLDDLLNTVLAQMITNEPDDDVALIAVRFHPEDGPRPAEAGPATA
jgi:serine phosphatase RsbU (regulator of sigma subunit)